MRTATLSISGLALGLAFAVAVASAQTPSPPTPSPSPGGSGGGARIPSPTPTPTPGQDRRQQPGFGQPDTQTQMQERAIFLSGRVMLDDGTPPPESIVIERVCNGTPRPEAYTDSKGRFSFQLGQNNSMVPDASVGGGTSSMGSAGSMGSMGSMGWGGNSSRGSYGGREGAQLMGCELRASLPGYRSEAVDLTGRRPLDNPDVGAIVLHRLGNIEGTTISATSLQAPKDAKTAYYKGTEALRKSKWPEARKYFEKAVEIYPKYAAAWYEIGRACQRQNDIGQAREAYGRALAADAKFLKPYIQMAGIAMDEKKWEEAAKTTDEVLRLDPVDFPVAYFYNSVARFNLRDLDAAERSARAGMKLDPNHRMPKFEHVLGLILANKQDYAGAAQFMKSYLQRVPDSQDAGTVRKQLVELEQLAAKRADQ